MIDVHSIQKSKWKNEHSNIKIVFSYSSYVISISVPTYTQMSTLYIKKRQPITWLPIIFKKQTDKIVYFTDSPFQVKPLYKASYLYRVYRVSAYISPRGFTMCFFACVKLLRFLTQRFSYLINLFLQHLCPCCQSITACLCLGELSTLPLGQSGLIL